MFLDDSIGITSSTRKVVISNDDKSSVIISMLKDLHNNKLKNINDCLESLRHTFDIDSIALFF